MAHVGLNRKDRQFIRGGAAQAASLLRVVGNEQRMLVLCLLIEYGEMTVGAILEQVPLSPSALSQHLAKMRDEGLVTFRRESQTLYYRLDNPDVETLMTTIKAMFCH